MQNHRGVVLSSAGRSTRERVGSGEAFAASVSVPSSCDEAARAILHHLVQGPRAGWATAEFDRSYKRTHIRIVT